MEDNAQKIVSGIIEDHAKRITAVINLCESPIEQLFLANFIRHYNSMSFLMNEWCVFDEGFQEVGYHAWKLNYGLPRNKANSTKYSTIGTPPIFLRGFKIDHFMLGISFKIFPQYEIEINQQEIFRVDFAVLVDNQVAKKIEDNEAIKVFIECDGFDFHKTPQQIKRDNERANLLKRQGWHEFRYSGKTICEDGFNAAYDLERFLEYRLGYSENKLGIA